MIPNEKDNTNMEIKKKPEYVDSCLTYEILLQDSGLAPKPKEDWNVFEPKKDDIAHVDADNSDYKFDGIMWVKIEETKIDVY